jgi:hypothetical protein
MEIVRSDALGATVELTRNELLALNGALNEVCHGPDAIEDWEFQTRMSVERQEAKKLLAEIVQLLRS